MGLNLCKERNLQTLHARFTLHLINIVLAMKTDIARAIQLVDQVSQQIEQNGTSFDRGYLYFLRGKTLLFEAKSIVEKQKRSQLINEAIAQLGKAKAEFQRIQSLSNIAQTLFIEAQAFNALEKVTQRNQISTQYIKICKLQKEQAQLKTCNFDSFYSDVMQWTCSFIREHYNHLKTIIV
jgi:hypothetical protein